MKTEWHISADFVNKASLDRWRKHHPAEFMSAFANLGKVLARLKHGEPLGGFGLAPLKSEGGGLWRIAQSGKKGKKEARLYVFPYEGRLHVLSIGGKESQPTDIAEARKAIGKIKGE